MRLTHILRVLLRSRRDSTRVDRVPATVLRFNSLSDTGYRIESRIYPDHLMRVLFARMMQAQFLAPLPHPQVLTDDRTTR